MRQPVAKAKRTIVGFSLSDEALLVYQYLCRFRLTQHPGSPTYAEMTAYFQARGRPIGRGTLSDCLDELESLGLIEQHQGQHRSITISRFVLELLHAPVDGRADAMTPAQADVVLPAHEMDGLIQELLAQYLKRHQISGIVTIDGRLMHLAEPRWVPLAG